MNLEIIISLVTIFVTYVCGYLAKKINWINNRLIPIQNLLIGIIAAIIYYIITKDLNLVIMSLGLFTGGTYDVFNNINKIRCERKTYKYF